MNRNPPFITLLPYFLLCGMYLLSSCTQQISGTEVGNPATVTGTVRDNQNKAVANAAVFLVAPEYNPVLDSIAPIESIGNQSGLSGVMIIDGDTQRVSTRTDSNGAFILDNVIQHAYNLFITDSSARRIVFKPRIAVDKKQMDLGICEMQRVGYAIITVADSVFKPNSFITLTGTPIKKAIDSAGQYTVPIVYDSMTINYYDNAGDTLSTIIRNQAITPVDSGDTIDLTGIETIIIPPVVAAIIGSDTLYSPIESVGVYDTLIKITAVGATINKNSLLEYQFYEATQKNLSEWNTDNNYLLLTKTGFNYSVACRVRSKSNKSIVTAWTPGLIIRTHYASDTIDIPVPSVPVLIDTFPYSDTIPYRFILRTSAVTDSLPYSFRLRWSDTANHSGFSPWEHDSIISIVFPAWGIYEIRAQARSVADTSKMSLWSDSLLFTVKP